MRLVRFCLTAPRVLFPKSAPLLSTLEAELLAFPGSRHDDQVVHALAYEQVERGGVDYIYLDWPKCRNYNDW
jgi:phage terminase large subunit-like protein